MNDKYVLTMENITKAFGGVQALKGANLQVRRGEVHALVGENGAGKSTLMKILTGVYMKDSGTVTIRGQETDMKSPNESQAQGVAMIFQEFSLIPTLSVAQNVFLKREERRVLRWMINDRKTARKTREILERIGVELNPTTKVRNLSVGYMQLVEIAKAISKNAEILVMDEPTASLSEAETGALFEFMHQLKKKGITIIYISHRMEEILQVCDWVTVLKDGETVLTDNAANITKAKLIDAMVGKKGEYALQWHPRSIATAGGEPLVSVRGLRPKSRMQPISFEIHAGEIVGLAGLMGSGRTRVAESIFGVHKPVEGTVTVGGKEIRGIRDAIAQGVAMVPENRRVEGLVLEHSVRANIIITVLKDCRNRFGLMSKSKGKKKAWEYIEQLSIRTEGPEKQVKLLSGGNQQKVVFAKWLAINPRVLILDEPTIGVDVGAKVEIINIVKSIADQGVAVLLVSSELPELLAACDRLLVLKSGTLTQEIEREKIASEEELHHAIQGI